jgi:hypothetical protein
MTGIHFSKEVAENPVFEEFRQARFIRKQFLKLIADPDRVCSRFQRDPHRRRSAFW